MDVKAVSAALNRYIDTHRTELARVPVIQSQLLELGALVLTAEHYKINGYQIRVSNLVDSKFRVKRTSGGKPWNFSWFVATRGKHKVEIHANLPVAGFYGKDDARYVVDVAVCKPDFLPIEPEAVTLKYQTKPQGIAPGTVNKSLTVKRQSPPCRTYARAWD